MRLGATLAAPTTVSIVAKRPNGDVSYAFHGHGAGGPKPDRRRSRPAALPEEVTALTFGSFYHRRRSGGRDLPRARPARGPPAV